MHMICSFKKKIMHMISYWQNVKRVSATQDTDKDEYA